MSRTDLAERLNTLDKTKKTTRLKVWRVETGKVQLPSDDLKLWARALKAKPSELIA